MSEELDKRELAFLEGPTSIGPFTLRPFSLGSLLLAFHFPMPLVLSGGDIRGLLPEEIERAVALYVWIHGSPVDEVLQLTRSGDWKKFGEVKFMKESVDLAAQIIEEIRRHAELIEEARFKIKGGGKKCYEPVWVATMVHNISQHRGWSEEWIMWHLPYARAIQYDHCALRSGGDKTREPGETKAAGDQLTKAREQAEKAAAEESEGFGFGG